MSKKIFDIFPPERVKKIHKIREKAPEIFLKPGKQKKVSWSGTFFKKGLILTFGLLVGGGVFCHFFLSQIEIEVWPKARVLNFEQKITVNSQIKELDLFEKIIPGQFFEQETEGSQQFSSTGIKEKIAKAKGLIRVYNNYHIPQTLVLNTGFLAEGKLFRTKERVHIPVDSYTDVEVEAVGPGPEYNIKPSTFSIPGLVGYPQYTAVYGKSFSPMKGGFVGEAAQVTQDDLDKAKEVLLQRLKDEAKDSLRNKIGTGSVFLDDAFEQEVVDYLSSVESGEGAENFTLQMRIKTKTLVFKEQDLEDFVKDFIKTDISQDEKIQESSFKIDYSLESADLKFNETQREGRIVLNLRFSAKIHSDITEVDLKEALQNKSLKETQIFLENHPGVEKMQINSWPFWMKKIPKDIEKTKIKLNLD